MAVQDAITNSRQHLGKPYHGHKGLNDGAAYEEANKHRNSLTTAIRTEDIVNH